MFDTEDVCCLSQETLKAQGFGKSLSGLLRALLDAGIVSRQAGTSRIPDTYRLRALAMGEAPRSRVAAARRYSAPAVPSRSTATPRRGSWPMPVPGAPGTAAPANTRPVRHHIARIRDPSRARRSRGKG
jgi:hypothetical protein